MSYQRVRGHIRKSGGKFVPVRQYGRVVGYVKEDALRMMMKPVKRTPMSPELKHGLEELRSSPLWRKMDSIEGKVDVLNKRDLEVHKKLKGGRL